MSWFGGNPSVNDSEDICDADVKHWTLHKAADGSLDDLQTHRINLVIT